MTVKFKQWDCTLVASYYATENRKALMLIDINDGEMVVVPTVNMSDYPCEENQVYIKNYSENKGILQILIDNELILPTPVNIIGSQFVKIPLMELTPKAMELWNPKKQEN